MHNGLGTMLRALVDQLDAAVQERYRQAGLDYRPRFTPIVRHLDAHGPSPLRAIAATAGVSHSAVSQTIAEMHRLGLVTKQAGQDAREQVVALSDSAVAMLPALRDCWKRTEAAAQGLSADVGCDLQAVIAEALHHLERRSFADRIAATAADSPGPAVLPPLSDL
jgi:DNA-binding MarR family transcriptional regulator